MKTTINESGAIVIQAENSVEAYALQCWSDKALIEITDLKRCEATHWCGSKLIVIAKIPEQQP